MRLSQHQWVRLVLLLIQQRPQWTSAVLGAEGKHMTEQESPFLPSGGVHSVTRSAYLACTQAHTQKPFKGSSDLCAEGGLQSRPVDRGRFLRRRNISTNFKARKALTGRGRRKVSETEGRACGRIPDRGAHAHWRK